ncbi:class I adenylate-forming enzyme family protein [Xenorhabdus miraniensis]|uniref:Putative CHAIN-FATTY-ACID-CoA LIGASE FADD13 n=1 Tax=Xenorhabdus miraniensis TaxID=351674 RepID=A0A2D0JPY1_9GAMM|nr:class I adenylate-forming enzyme family protein [Xenorhabdus miraniensis]PHM48225.1 putative CHAIN-FATTY-ACID-CoA LIGASE FADD13 [Xenorhabdus miraniensis]
MYENFLKVANDNINNVAINSAKKTITYGKLNEYVNKLAFLLNNYGITNNTSVGLFFLNSTLHIISVLALSKIKAKMIFFHPKMTEEEFNKIKFFKPEYIIFDESDIFKIDNLTYPTSHIEFLDLYLVNCYKYKTHQIELQNNIKGDIVFLSSGSTGYYKGIVKTEEQILTERRQIISTLDVKKNDRIICSAQLCHSYGFMFGMIVPLLTGSEITYTDPIILVSSLERLLKKNTIFVGLPTHYRLLCNYSNQTFRNIKIALSGGSNIPSEDQKKIELLGIKISNIYGMSETGALMVENNHNNNLLSTYPYRPIAGVEIKLDYSVKYDYLDQFSYEIIVKTNSLCTCIIDNGIAKENYFGQWFSTGDLAVKNEGKFHIVGRKDLTINVGGKKINPFEIESILKEHPNVNEAVVYGISDIKRGQIPIAIVEVNKKTDLTELFDLCYKKLSAHKIPKKIEVKDFLPTSSIGKILRKLN